MQQLGNMKDSFDDLSDPEQFACLVSVNSRLPLSPTLTVPNRSHNREEKLFSSGYRIKLRSRAPPFLNKALFLLTVRQRKVTSTASR